MKMDIATVDTLSPALAAALRGADDLTVPMRELAGDLLLHTRERFDREVSPAGVPWKPSKRAVEEGGRTLFDQGFLKAAITPTWGRDFAGVGVQATAGPARYARIQQEGGTIRPRKGKALSFAGKLFAAVVIPARPYLGIDDDDRRSALTILGSWAARLFAAGGTRSS